MGPAGYSLSDLLMFSPEVYFRLFVLYNQALWPVQVVVVVLTVAIVALTRRPSAAGTRTVAGLMAVSWAGIAWFFLLQRYAEINLAAPWFAAGFALQAVLWVGMVVVGRPLLSWGGGRYGRMGLALLGVAAVVLPLMGPLSGRAWTGVELFGLAPDPTAVGTLGILLAAPRSPWLFWLVPVAWSLISGLTYVTMGVFSGLGTPALAGVALAIRCLQARRHVGSRTHQP